MVAWLATPPMARVVAAATVSTLMCACAVQLRTTVEEQGQRIDELEQGIREEREQLQQEVARAETKVAELEQVLEQATQVVTRNSADLGADVEQLRGEIASLQGQLAEARNEANQLRTDLNETRRMLNQRVDVIAQRVGIDPQVPASEVPEDQAAHFAEANQAHQAQDYARARALFREYVRRYPQDDNADNAQYWIGKAYLQEDRPQSALGEFRRVLAEYASSDAIDETLFDMADAFYRVHNCTQARTALETLINTQPRSSLVGDARRKLRQVQRSPRGYCTS